ncbi:MAG: hypothetical protein ACRC3I_10545 [Cetobacterium sp.]
MKRCMERDEYKIPNGQKIKYELYKDMVQTEFERRNYFYSKATLLASGQLLIITAYLFYLRNSSILTESKYFKAIMIICFISVIFLSCSLWFTYLLISSNDEWGYLPEPSKIEKDFTDLKEYIIDSENMNYGIDEYYITINIYYLKVIENNIRYNNKMNENFQKSIRAIVIAALLLVISSVFYFLEYHDSQKVANKFYKDKIIELNETLKLNGGIKCQKIKRKS